MTQIIVLSSEENDPRGVGVLHAGVEIERALAMCEAAAKFFSGLVMEKEIQRRVEREKDEKNC